MMIYMDQRLDLTTLVVVFLFIVGCIALSLTARTLKIAPDRLKIRRLLHDEDGAVYSLSLVLALPFYVLVIATIAECALMITVKLGTINAAYAASRAAIVWKAAEVDSTKQDAMIHLAAAQAMTPFASSKLMHLEPTGPANSIASVAGDDYYQAYRAYSAGNAPPDYLKRKLQFALAATEVKIEETSHAAGHDFEADLRVTVTYEKPIDLPVIGRFLGAIASWSGAKFFTRRIESTLVLQKEAPKSASRTLGINYDSWNY